MTKRFAFSMAAVWAAASLPVLANAQAPGDPYEALLRYLASEELQQEATKSVLESTRRQFEANADIAEMEGECPGTVDEMMKVMEQSVGNTMHRDTASYQEQVLAILQEELTPDEARKALDFFTSDLGQKFLHQITGALSYDRSLASAIRNDDGNIDRAAYEADRKATIEKVTTSLSSEDMAAAEKIISEGGWGPAMQRANPRLSELRYKTFNQPLSAEEDAALEDAFTKALEAHIAHCEASGDKEPRQ